MSLIPEDPRGPADAARPTGGIDLIAAPQTPTPTGQVPFEVLRRLSMVSARINAGERLGETLQAVADGVVEGLGFGAAAVNLRRPDGDFEVVAVSGPADAIDVLRNHVIPSDVMAALLERAEIWGALRFVRHGSAAVPASHAWTPSAALVDETAAEATDVVGQDERWHPEDALAAVLRGAHGRMVGVLSVDLPPGGRIPDETIRELLELFSLQAGIAIDNARSYERRVSDQAQLAREHDRVRASESTFRTAFQDSAGAMAMLDPTHDAAGLVLQVNPAMARMLGYDAEHMIGKPWRNVLHPDDLDDVNLTMSDLISGKRTEARRQGRLRRADGVDIWVSFAVSMVDPSERDAFLLVQVEDLTERQKAEEVWRQRADHDELTGLLRRRVFVGHLARAAERIRVGGRAGAVLFCDLDDFKPINDRLGHTAGDRALIEIADRLRDMLRSRDSVARFGGDEFVILADDLTPAELGGLRDRIRAVISRPLTTVPAKVGVSIGLQVVDGSIVNPEEILALADAAMYEDKDGRHTR